jgi:hypothetical protein
VLDLGVVSLVNVKAGISQIACLYDGCFRSSRHVSVEAKFIIYYTIHCYRDRWVAFGTGIVLTLERLHFPSQDILLSSKSTRVVPIFHCICVLLLILRGNEYFFRFVSRIRSVHQHVQAIVGKQNGSSNMIVIFKASLLCRGSYMWFGILNHVAVSITIYHCAMPSMTIETTYYGCVVTRVRCKLASCL